MKIIVTGSAGFIGSHLVKALGNAGHDVFGIDKKTRPMPGAMPIDIADAKQLNEYIETFIEDPEMIIHFAGSCSTQHGIDYPDQDFKDNAIGSFNIVEVAKQYGIPVIYASSCKIEPGPGGIRTPYGLSKFIGEQYCVEFGACYGIEYIVNRMGTIYGPGQEGSPESGWIAWFIKATLENLPLTIFGTGEQVRDVLYIDDLVKLVLDQVENFEAYANRIYNVGGGEQNAVDLLQVLDYLGYKNYTFAEKRLGDVDRYVAGLKRVKKVNGWKPTIDWEEGLRKTLTFCTQK